MSFKSRLSTRSLAIPRASVALILRTMWLRAWSPVMARALERELGIARVMAVLASNRLGRAMEVGLPMAEQLAAVLVWRRGKVKEIEARKQFWEGWTK